MSLPTPTELVHAAITEKGRITFAEFMEIALYAPGVGYYTASPASCNESGTHTDRHSRKSDRHPHNSDRHSRDSDRHSRESGNPQHQSRSGPPHDYYTAPQLHAVFGAYLARHVAQIWRELGAPEHFDVVELGAGRGMLAWDILRGLRDTAPRCWERTHYRLVDRGPAPGVREQEALAEVAAHPVHSDRELVAPVSGVVLSNELLDALPVQRVCVEEKELKEVYITLRDGRLTEVVDRPSSEDLVAFVERLGMPPEGWRGEISLQAAQWLEHLAQELTRGTVITIDYGATWEDLCGPRHAGGTLACYYRHRVSKDLYARLGAQDITAHVNFSALMNVGAGAGLRTTAYQSQAEYLIGLGIGEELTALSAQPPTVATQRAKRAITDLVWPDGMGGFRVLVQEKNSE